MCPRMQWVDRTFTVEADLFEADFKIMMHNSGTSFTSFYVVGQIWQKIGPRGRHVVVVEHRRRICVDVDRV
jgi:hypothetical protein